MRLDRSTEFDVFEAGELPGGNLQTGPHEGTDIGFCDCTEEILNLEDASLIETGKRELETFRSGSGADVADGVVIRSPQAYPLYDTEDNAAVATIRGYRGTLENLMTIGRNGQRRYSNHKNSILTGMYAARKIPGAHHDLWRENVGRAYCEEMHREVAHAARSSNTKPVEA
jgi:hypothetical protein